MKSTMTISKLGYAIILYNPRKKEEAVKRFTISLLGIAIMLLNGCGGSAYHVEHYADRFSSDNAYTVSTRGNYLQDNPLGDDILNIIPTLDLRIKVNRNKNCIENISLFLYHPEHYSTGFLTGSRNATWVHIVRGSKLIFLADGKRVVLYAANAKQRTRDNGYNNVSQEATMEYIDEAVYPINLRQLKQIAYANRVEVKVEGLNHSHTYLIGTNGNSVVNQNLAKNFRKFYQEQILTRKLCK